MEIKVLSFDGCPNAQPAAELVRSVVDERGIPARITEISVENAEEAAQYHFLGSPTIQVDGRDIEASRQNDEPSFSCRVYAENDGNNGVPARALMEAALTESQR